jgi:hypothetical protein
VPLEPCCGERLDVVARQPPVNTVVVARPTAELGDGDHRIHSSNDRPRGRGKRLRRTGSVDQRPNRDVAGDVCSLALLEAAVSRVGAHVLPVAAMTTHLAALRPIGRSGVMMRFGSLESAIAATAPTSLRDP